MAAGVERLKAQTVVVGSGPGGATVARELAVRGKDVLILELGAYHRPVGNWINMFRMMEPLAGEGKLWRPFLRQCAAIC